VEREQVNIIALPGDDFTESHEAHSDHIGDGTVRAVLAGNPIWIFEGERARGNRKYHVSVEDSPRGFAQVSVDANRSGMRLRGNARGGCEERKRCHDRQRSNGAKSNCANHAAFFLSFANAALRCEMERTECGTTQKSAFRNE
jgi:hypothetical protein